MTIFVNTMAPHNKCCGDPNHSHDDVERGIQYSLYTKINTNDLQCLNEVVPDSGKKVFKAWENRLDRDMVSFLLEHVQRLDFNQRP